MSSRTETRIKVLREVRDDTMNVEYHCDVRVSFTVDGLIDETVPTDFIAAKLVEELRRFVNAAESYEVVKSIATPARKLRHCPYCGSEIGGLS